jgi:hypothetical protein
MKNNKKGFSFIVVIILLCIILAIFVPMYKMLHKDIKQFSNKNISSSYNGFYASGITTLDDPATGEVNEKCLVVTKNGQIDHYSCSYDTETWFEISITNSGKQPYSLYGGVLICPAECEYNYEKCKHVIDDTCITIRGTEKCSIINDGKPYPCDGGTYPFSKGVYFVYPVVTCPLDKTTGCFDPSWPLTEPVQIINYEIGMELHATR